MRNILWTIAALAFGAAVCASPQGGSSVGLSSPFAGALIDRHGCVVRCDTTRSDIYWVFSADSMFEGGPAVLDAVIRSNRKYMSLVWQQQPPSRLCHDIGFFRCKFALQEHIGLALDHSKYCAFLTFPDDQIHLPVSETCAVGLHRTLMDGYAVGDERLSRRNSFAPFVPAVFHFMAAMLF